MLDCAVDDPFELGEDLVGARAARSRAPSSSSKSQGLPSAPRAIITAATPVCLEGLASALRACATRRSG